ncbi:MAG: exopolysaccharide biosynthesis polyprenyl glycosylphosphotransferase [Verrucomicrobia bacterium]|nr:exopolysaccharide biosynthesis polyprenyl glycosylphosphotransferase [Verrucomicrobiota bacterium]
MLTHLQRTRTRLFEVADGCLFAISLLAAYYLRDACVGWFNWEALAPIGDYLWLVPVVALIGPIVLAGQGFYESPRPAHRLRALFAILRSCSFTVIGLILVLFVLRQQYARSVVILVGTISGILVSIRYEVAFHFQSQRFAQEQLRRRALWVGLPHENRQLRDALTRIERDTLADLGEFNPVTQPVDEFVRALHDQSVNVVILNLAGIDRDHATRVLLACANEGVEVVVRPGITSLPSPQVSVDRFGGEAVFYYRAQSAPLSHLVIKQTFDYIAATLLLVVLSPLLALIAAAVKLTSPGPVFYRQVRCGLNGRSFGMLKFRSMTAGAEQQQAALAGQNEMRGPVFKVSKDPRVTPLGRVLRRHSLDELPQLWNVMRGEMSLVGPRPLPFEEVKRFDQDTHRRRLSVKPGLTCLWQISGRNDIADFADWVRLDLAYIDQWSLWLDFKILVATIPAALFGRGAR